MAKPSTNSKTKYFLGSVYQWALASFILGILPLMIAIIFTMIEVENLTQKSQLTLLQTVDATESSRIILDRLISMERSIRQYQVLNEPELFISYQEHRARLLIVLESLKSKRLDPSLINILKNLNALEYQLYQHILSNSEDDQLKLTKSDLNIFDKLTAQARLLVAEGEKRVSIEADDLSIIAKHVRQRMIFAALVSISLAFILALIFVHFLTRPLKDIGRAIRNLGEVGFEHPIHIKGPDELTKLGLHLEWLRQKLNHVEYEKQQFIRNVSHELKTPLATLKEGTDLLSENVVGELNTEQQEIIQLMKIGNITINDLVENLLEYQRAISTQIDINFSTFNLSKLIKRIINEYQLLLRSKNITMNCNFKKVYICADYDKIKIIISNILSNALKFSPHNGIIGISLNSNDIIIELIIEDQGPGISKEIQPYIFQDFYRGNSSQEWKIKASGLGLALVKHYLEAHNGSIKLLPPSKDYFGARFSLEFPQQEGN